MALHKHCLCPPGPIWTISPSLASHTQGSQHRSHTHTHTRITTSVEVKHPQRSVTQWTALHQLRTTCTPTARETKGVCWCQAYNEQTIRRTPSTVVDVRRILFSYGILLIGAKLWCVPNRSPACGRWPIESLRLSQLPSRNISMLVGEKKHPCCFGWPIEGFLLL